MDRTTVCISCLALILVGCILIAGCSDTDTKDQTVQTGTTTAAGALYSAGDVVRNPASAASTAWLVIGYDDETDMYERALIYPNPDGSWGYRKDTRTEKIKREIMEKVFTELVENIPPASVPVETPTIVTTEPTTQKTLSTSGSVTTATTTTTASGAPKITNIIPDKGDAGTTVQITDLIGGNFRNGANVTLSRSGSYEIRATDVRAVTPKSITCSFAIPADAPAGAWDVVVTNLDGQSDRYTNIFSVHRTGGVLTTTSAIMGGTVPVTFIDPAIGHASNNQIMITGSGFQNGATVKLQKTGQPDITARESIFISQTSIQCFIDIPAGSSGAWDVVVTNPDKTYGVRYGALSVT